MIIREYIQKNGQSSFSRWFEALDRFVAAKVTTALYRLEQGNHSNVKSVGEGVMEYKIDFGPGYRIYFGKDGLEIIILLGGGSKKQQNKDIAIAKQHWNEYKQRKKQRA
jgi:putative addiction module killer protein